MNTYTFSPKTMTCNGHTYTVEYCLQPSGVVTVFVQLDDRQARIRIDRKMPEYAAARAAAEEARDAWNADTPVNPAEEDYTIMSKDGVVIAQCSHHSADIPAPVPERAEIISPAAPAPTAPAADIPAPAPERAEIISPADPAPTAPADDIPAPAPERAEIISPVAPAADPKAARAAAPEKTFAGTEIAGNGWKILFDADQQRTRIIFAADPTDAAKKVLDAAGFFYSGRMQSWNKKLTFRAYRAAQFVAQELNAIYSA